MKTRPTASPRRSYINCYNVFLQHPPNVRHTSNLNIQTLTTPKQRAPYLAYSVLFSHSIRIYPTSSLLSDWPKRNNSRSGETRSGESGQLALLYGPWYSWATVTLDARVLPKSRPLRSHAQDHVLPSGAEYETQSGTKNRFKMPGEFRFSW